MSQHVATIKKDAGREPGTGWYSAWCSCGWTAAFYQQRGEAQKAHTAHRRLEEGKA